VQLKQAAGTPRAERLSDALQTLFDLRRTSLGAAANQAWSSIVELEDVAAGRPNCVRPWMKGGVAGGQMAPAQAGSRPDWGSLDRRADTDGLNPNQTSK
jgi:hypothetical protein